jgi:hypothetical protein
MVGDTQYGPYANSMNVGMKWEIEHDGDSAFNEFICDLVVDGLATAALLIAPEFAGPEVVEDLELEALCGSLAEASNDNEKRAINVTENAVLIGGYS